jgi:hypothetical protein
MRGPDPLQKRGIRPQVSRQGAGTPVDGGERLRVSRRFQDACGQNLARLGGGPSREGYPGPGQVHAGSRSAAARAPRFADSWPLRR